MSIDTKLEYWKSRLLDLGKRNRLINCPDPRQKQRVSRVSLTISHPDNNNLWTRLTESDKGIVFSMPATNEIDIVQDDNPIIDQNIHIDDGSIITNQSSAESYKTLRSLMRKAKEFNEEKGLNALYLAFGFLHWHESDHDGSEMRSPLILMPIKLTQEDLFSPISVSRLDEEITTNYCLEQKLMNDYGIILPSWNEEVNIDKYFCDIQEMIRPYGWQVSTSAAQISLFSFMKINMYRDLEQNAELIKANPIIRALDGEVLDSNDYLSDLKDFDHDKVEPSTIFSVVDADGSQQDAVLFARHGISFVLQGPPGTGKSQTITNIIAELIAEGKKVLFVSEKVAALEVVSRRLKAVGLEDFCLTLHSHNTKRRNILDQFERSLKISRQRVSLQEDARTKLYRLKETRDALNQYSRELHTLIQPLGKTIYQVSGLLSELESYPNIDYVQNNAHLFTQEMLTQCEAEPPRVFRRLNVLSPTLPA